MYLTIISDYELGQFLRILLWICVPMAMFALLVTTWLQYRRRQGFSEGLLLSMEGASAGEEEALNYHSAGMTYDGTGACQNGSEPVGHDQSRDDRVEEAEPRVAETFGEEDYKENLYKGILWMKDKYEQYRETADLRYERLKDQLAKVEKRYEELLASLGGSQPIVRLKPSEGAESTEAAIRSEAGALEPFSPADPVGMESVVPVEPGPLGERIWPVEARVEADEPRQSPPGPGVGAHEPRLWNSEQKVEMAEMPVAEREERTHVQELEEQLARTRQRLEEELGRVRYQLEEEVARSRRQQDEQAAIVETNRHLEQQMAYSNRQLEEKQRIIADLEGQLRSDRQKIEELVTKLRNNSQLLMKIYQELDKSLHFNDVPKEG
jgi:hypothetical protein